mmetsp:Transcript_27287/g.91293  ORF Transcript_27287/g.91293 Transcript_27287/m.91293 type:complete len:216 (-) Transcript_27287:251-898(-)
MRTRNSFLRRRLPSDSPSPRSPQRASISSMNIMAGLCSAAISKRLRTSFSDSPTHLETRSEEDTEKKVDCTWEATALARWLLPVPGGPYSRMPRHGVRAPVNSCGYRTGRTTASCRASLASSRPATSSQRTRGRSTRMLEPSCSRRRCTSAPWDLAPPPLPPIICPPAAATGPFSDALRCSARSMYSLIFWRSVALVFSFFSYLSTVMKCSSADS